jgi:predicted RNA-binding protein with PIN domain
MFFFLDGYNLMHAAGFMGPRVPQNQLAGARQRFLDWLATATHGKETTLRVIFDAQDAPRKSPLENHRGIEVQFAYRETADDCVELELQNRPRGSATVVSDDTRWHEAARRRGCGAWTNSRFQDWLLEAPTETPTITPTTELEKPQKPTPADFELLQVFKQPKPRGKR